LTNDPTGWITFREDLAVTIFWESNFVAAVTLALLMVSMHILTSKFADTNKRKAELAIIVAPEAGFPQVDRRAYWAGFVGRTLRT